MTLRVRWPSPEKWSPSGGIIDEHNGDIVFDLIHPTALFAGECVSFRFVVEVAFALRTTKYFEQLFLNHISDLPV